MAEIINFENSRKTPLDIAQDLAYDAWEATSKKEKIKLAEQALKASPDCADAYVILAEEKAKNLSEKTEFYEKAVAAGERGLGEGAFERYIGDFWGIIHTRPYMRARYGMVECWIKNKRYEEAIRHCRDLLLLDPNDSLGIRYKLPACLFALKRYDEIVDLLEKHGDECFVIWKYTAALLSFILKGDNEENRKLLYCAIDSNIFVLLYIFGTKKIPRRLPEEHGLGDENEAILYAADNKSNWVLAPKARKWLENICYELFPETI